MVNECASRMGADISAQTDACERLKDPYCRFNNNRRPEHSVPGRRDEGMA